MISGDMKYIKISVAEIIKFLGDKVIGVEGKWQELFIDNLAEVERVNETTLDWINPTKSNKQMIAESSKANVLLVDESINPVNNKVLIKVKNPKIALAEVGNYYFVKKPIPGIHPTAIIDSEAHIGTGVTIGAYCVVGKAVIGDRCVIESNVKVYDDTFMGNDCVVDSGAVLGGQGFGFIRDANGNLIRFPQIGQLIIGNNVEIGANSSIDRGALSDTVIGDYTKISNLCHIAHNNKIGKNVVITCGSDISGSNVIEDNVWIAPNTSIRGWVHIGKDAFLGMGAVVVKDVPAGETWIGNPARKLLK